MDGIQYLMEYFLPKLANILQNNSKQELQESE